MRNIKGFCRLFVVVVVWAGCGASSPPALMAQPAPDMETRVEVPVDFLPEWAKPTIQLELGKVGVLLTAEGLAEWDQAIEAIQAYGLELDRQGASRDAEKERVLVFRAPEARARQQISLLAAALADATPEYVARAGIVARVPGSERPALVTREFIVDIRADAPREELEQFHKRNGVALVRSDRVKPSVQLLRVDTPTGVDGLAMAQRYMESGLVENAEPNLIRVPEFHQTIPNDPFFADQWHLRNTGQSGGATDADIDAEFAWDITQGNANVVIAVIDSSFDMTHPDLQPNLWTNTGETVGDGIDNDGNGFVDDVNGWDFNPCSTNPVAGCGDNDPSPVPGESLTWRAHGTAAAGGAVARGNNATGVSGSCPNCQLMPLRLAFDTFSLVNAFNYATAMGADVMSNSWSTLLTTQLQTAIQNAANNGRGGLGSVVLFAVSNANINDCGSGDIPSLAAVTAVARVSNQDRFDQSAFGDCVDVMGPAVFPGSSLGTLNNVTTDVQGTNGYNNESGATCFSTEPTNRDYTFCFDGTSFATPVTAGIAGLIIDADSSLTGPQVRRLLQDTTDKAEPSLGNYDPGTGYSNDANLAVAATHAYGRVNAFEAARVAADGSVGGNGGVDVMLRDNGLDWGNTQRLSNLTFDFAATGEAWISRSTPRTPWGTFGPRQLPRRSSSHSLTKNRVWALTTEFTSGFATAGRKRPPMSRSRSCGHNSGQACRRSRTP